MLHNRPTNTHLKKRNRIYIIPAAIMLIVIGIGLFSAFGSQSTKRWFKSLQSEYTGGLNRTVTVYDNNGNVLREWNGKIDLEESTYGNKVLFDLDGKRKTVYNAIVIVEED